MTSRSRPPAAHGRRSPTPTATSKATDVVVGAEAAGRLVSFDPQEGQNARGQAPSSGRSTRPSWVSSAISSTAQREANASRVNEVAQQIDVLQAQRRRGGGPARCGAGRSAPRSTRSARSPRRATSARKRLVRPAGGDRPAARPGRARRSACSNSRSRRRTNRSRRRSSQIAAQAQPDRGDPRAATDRAVAGRGGRAQIAQVAERIRKSEVSNPIAGTVLTTYAKAGEVVQPGQPLYKIANLDSVEVRAYVTEPQLSAGPARRRRTSRSTPAAGRADRCPARSRGSRRRPSSRRRRFRPATSAPTWSTRSRFACRTRAALLKIGMPVDVQFAGEAGAPGDAPVAG